MPPNLASLGVNRNKYKKTTLIKLIVYIYYVFVVYDDKTRYRVGSNLVGATLSTICLYACTCVCVVAELRALTLCRRRLYNIIINFVKRTKTELSLHAGAVLRVHFRRVGVPRRQ